MSQKEVVSPSFRNDCGLFHVNVNYDNEGKVVAISVVHKKSGGCINTLWKLISTLINLCLENGVPIDKIHKIMTEVDKTNCDIFHCPTKPSCIVGVGQAIEECESK